MMARISIRTPRAWCLLLGGVLCLSAPPLPADVIQLHNGGEIRGEIERQTVKSDGPLKIALLSGTEIEIPRDQVKLFAFRSVKVEEFESQWRRTPQTPEDLWKLAQWCTQNRLTEQRTLCLESIIELQPHHAEARRLLDHVEYKGEWMPREEMMRQRGYVKYRNRYITEQEMALLQKSQAQRDAEREWTSRIRQWNVWLYSGNPQRAQEALASLKNLNDPEAIQGLITVLRNHPDANARVLMIEALAAIGTADAIPHLATQAVFDSSADVRYQALMAIPEDQYLPAAERVAFYLRNADNTIVRRAAFALQTLGGDDTIDDLINALVTQHTVTIQVPAPQPFTLNMNTQTGQFANPGEGMLPADIELLYRAGQLPYGYQVASAPTVKMRPVKVRVNTSNEEVLAALQKLTGQNFGYDERTWRLWYAAHKNQAPALSNAPAPG